MFIKVYRVSTPIWIWYTLKTVPSSAVYSELMVKQGCKQDPEKHIFDKSGD